MPGLMASVDPDMEGSVDHVKPYSSYSLTMSLKGSYPDRILQHTDITVDYPGRMPGRMEYADRVTGGSAHHVLDFNKH